MRILKEGIVQSDTHRGTCERCGCEVEVYTGELKTREAAEDETPYYCDCPTQGCGGRIYFWLRRW